MKLISYLPIIILFSFLSCDKNEDTPISEQVDYLQFYYFQDQSKFENYRITEIRLESYFYDHSIDQTNIVKYSYGPDTEPLHRSNLTDSIFHWQVEAEIGDKYGYIAVVNLELYNNNEFNQRRMYFELSNEGKLIEILGEDEFLQSFTWPNDTIDKFKKTKDFYFNM